ncbi:MAG: carboxypeptidase regulatory-like domain-containing protein, partial [Planctomycetaceae bacterium]|nr:carboxypeptidase regulatory-like domain-containing protein [Planctomycetaceae bacterium]
MSAVWREAEAKLNAEIERLKSRQRPDGSLPLPRERGGRRADGVPERLDATSEQLCWAVMALPQRDLSDQWVANAFSSLCRDVRATMNSPVRVQVVSSAARAIRVYLSRIAPKEIELLRAKISGHLSAPDYVVGVRVKTTDTAEASLGSGIVVGDFRGVLTCAHVIPAGMKSDNDISVILQNGRELPARVTAVDRQQDLALLAVDTALPIPAAKLDDTAEVAVGDSVRAFGLRGDLPLMSRGTVSAVRREVTIRDDLTYHDLIQVDIPFESGTSGGPLLDASNCVVGVACVIRRAASGRRGFAIPVRTIASFLRANSRQQHAQAADSSDSAAGDNRVTVRGTAVDDNDEPIAGAVVTGRTFNGQAVSATTDEQGNFEFPVSADQIAVSLRILDADGRRLWTDLVYVRRSRNAETLRGVDEPLIAKLVPVMESQISVVDGGGRPVKGATVVVQNGLSEVDVLNTDDAGHAMVRLPQNAQPMILAFKSAAGYDYFSADVRDANNYPVKDPPKLPGNLKLVLNGARTVRVKAVDSQGNPISGAKIRPWYVRKEGNPGDTNFGSDVFNQRTDADGVAVFDWIPPDVSYGLTFWPTAEGYDADRLDIRWKDFDESKTYEAVFKTKTQLSGRVSDVAGQPVTGAEVRVHGEGANRESSDETTESDESGGFAMLVPSDKAYVAWVTHGELVGYASPIVIREGQPQTDVEVTLAKGTVIHGQVTRGTPPRPVAGEWILLSLARQPIRIDDEAAANDPNNGFARLTFYTGMNADKDGRFRFVAAPGEYSLAGPRQAKQHKFVVAGEEELEFNFGVPLEEMMFFVGNVKGPDGKPLADVSIYGVHCGWTHARHSFSGKTDADGHFRVERETSPAVVQYLSADKSMGALLPVDDTQE